MRKKKVWYQAYPLTHVDVEELKDGDTPTYQEMRVVVRRHWCFEPDDTVLRDTGTHEKTGEENENI